MPPTLATYTPKGINYFRAAAALGGELFVLVDMY
jgi:hypothetical protein